MSRFPAATSLVQVEVVVHDRDGHPIADLTRDDFRVYEDGKEQAVESFSVESQRSAATPSTAPSPGVFTNRQAGRATGGVTVILLDRLNTRFEDQSQARAHVIKFLEQVHPDDRVALYVLESNSVRVLHDFTTDTASLRRALARYRPGTSHELDASEQQAPEAPDPADADMVAWLQEVTEKVDAVFTARRVEATNAAFEAIAHHLSGVRGRKNVVWISSGFPLTVNDQGQRSFSDEVRRATRAINDANVAVYPVDARGLMPALSLPTGARAPVFNTLATIGPNTEGMDTIADQTGGRAFHNTNDIAGAIRRAVEDTRLTYLIGYSPAHEKWDGRFHEIKVKVQRPGLEVRHRKGYLASEPQSEKRKDGLSEAVYSPLEATAIGLTARLERVEGAAAGQVALALQLEPASVTVEQKGDHWEGSFEVSIVQSLPNGSLFTSLNTTVGLRLTAELHDRMLREGIVVNRRVPLREDALRLLIVVSDVRTGATGSLIIPATDLRAALGR